jgi:hypothetical protein
MKRLITRVALLLSGTLMQAIASCQPDDSIVPMRASDWFYCMYGTRSPLADSAPFTG